MTQILADNVNVSTHAEIQKQDTGCYNYFSKHGFALVKVTKMLDKNYTFAIREWLNFLQTEVDRSYNRMSDERLTKYVPN